MVMLGRTGNNLFQYALGRKLAARHGTRLVMDGSWFLASDWKAVSCLGRLPIRAELRRCCSLGSRVLRKVTGRHPWEFAGVPVWKEAAGAEGFDARFLEAPADCVLMGYFQSPRYFEDEAEALRAEMNLESLPWSGATRELAARLASEQSVAVHVRRTDFVGRAEFDLCGAAYYREAIGRMRDVLKGPRFHVFSDDPESCASFLTGRDVEVVPRSEESADPLRDLYLMSCARHQVIANSSYSWWAAWLGRQPGQRVVAPDRWLGGEISTPIGERLCEGWETIRV